MNDLSNVEREMLALLTAAPQRCTGLGEQLWYHGRGSTAGGRSTCAWARPAGKVLHRLKARGLARHVSGRNGGWVRI